MSDRITSCREAHLLVIDILLLLFFTTASPTVGQGQTLRGLQTVSPTHKLEKRLKGGETHSYQITLKAGDYFHVGVEQRAIDVVLLVTGPDGKTFVERDRPNGTGGQESLSFIAPAQGEYRLDVKSPDEKAEAGSYEIDGEPPRIPTEQDRKRVEAENFFQEGFRLGQAKTPEAVAQACVKYEAASALWRELEDRYAEALSQTGLGEVRERLGRNEEAVSAHERALSLYRELKDVEDEASSLGSLCN